MIKDLINDCFKNDEDCMKLAQQLFNQLKDIYYTEQYELIKEPGIWNSIRRFFGREVIKSKKIELVVTYNINDAKVNVNVIFSRGCFRTTVNGFPKWDSNEMIVYQHETFTLDELRNFETSNNFKQFISRIAHVGKDYTIKGTNT
jgi:hypothetical protein